MMDEEESRNKNDFLQFLLKVKDESDSKTPLTMVQLKALLMVTILTFDHLDCSIFIITFNALFLST